LAVTLVVGATVSTTNVRDAVHAVARPTLSCACACQ
jgi:hypothetical protein